MTAPPVIVIGGPTASGKSTLALHLAERLGGEIINADSMQVYRDLRLLTARPSDDDLRRVPHRLYGVLDATDPCSAGRWQASALQEIAAVQAAGKRAIVVGGTGLYLRALIEGIAPVPDVPAEIRARARARLNELGLAGFGAEFAARDPVMAARLKPGDTQRLTRAWEVLEATGRSLAAWQDDPVVVPALTFTMAAVMPPREQLYAACDSRLDAMVAAGVLDEVAALATRVSAKRLAADLPLLKAVGFAELAAHVAGEMNLPDALAAAQQATRRYAKRQVAWFRHQLPDRKDGPLAHVQVLKFNYVSDREIFSLIT